MIKKLSSLFLAVLTIIFVNTEAFAQAGCMETAGTLTAPSGAPTDDNSNFTMCSDGSDANLYIQASPPGDNGDLPDYSYILQIPDGSGGVTLVISTDGTLDPTNPAGDGTIPALQPGDVIEVTGAAYDIAALNSLINTLDLVCPGLEAGGTVPPGTCAVITDLINGVNDGMPGLQSLEEALGIASALGAPVTDAASALDALVSVDAAAQLLGGVCYAVTGWPDPATPGVPADDTADPPIPAPSTFWEGPGYVINVIECISCTAAAASISTSDATSICAGDGVADPVNVSVDDAGDGVSSTFVITDDQGIILDIPSGTGPFDFEGAGGGICQIWHLNFDPADFTDADGGSVEAGDDATALLGCFALSNPIAIDRSEALTATITDPACSQDLTEFSVTVTVTADASATVTVTSSDGTLVDNNDGTYTVTMMDGGNIGTITVADDTACEDVVFNDITTVCNTCTVAAASISTGDATTICAGDGVADPVNVSVDDAGDGVSSTFVITDDQGIILDIPSGTGPFDFEGAGEGVCQIWHLNFDPADFTDADGGSVEAGDDATGLLGCFALSAPIVVDRIAALQGSISDPECSLDNTEFTVTVTVDQSDSDAIVNIDATEGSVVDNFDGTYTITITSGGSSTITLSDDTACGDVVFADVTADCTVPCEITAASISTSDNTTICLNDDVVEEVNVTVDGGGGVGASGTFVITDDQGIILDIPSGNGPFEFEGAPPGVCQIWYVYFDGNNFTDADGGAVDAGDDATALQGCFALSNPIAVTRNDCGSNCDITAASISTSDNTTICLNDGVVEEINVTVDGGGGTNATGTFVITDDQGIILDIPSGNGPFEFEGAPAGVCQIWYVYFDGNDFTDANGSTVDAGDDATALLGCFALSNPIAVTRNDCSTNCDITAASISTSDNTTICLNDGVVEEINVTVDGGGGTNATGTFVITDDQGIILDIPSGNGPFEFEGAPAGVCQIWYVYFDGNDFTDANGGAVDAGDDATALLGCFALSNPIVVTRNDCSTNCDITAASISTSDNTTICLNDGVVEEINVTVDGGGGTNATGTFVITDDQGIILDIPSGNGPFEFEGAPAGVCQIWYVYFDGNDFTDANGGAVDAGDDATALQGCFALSNPISVTRNDCTPGGCDANPGTLVFPGSGN